MEKHEARMHARRILQKEEAYTGQQDTCAKRTLLIIAPHPDDEAIMGGVIKQGLDNGDEVYVLVATLGDYDGVDIGRQRMAESIRAMALLGLPKDRLLFLGYGDNGGMEQYPPQRFTDSLLYRLYTAQNPAQVIPSRAGRRETYNGAASSYHAAIWGRQAPYTRENFLGDVRHAIYSIRPDEIYTTSPFDMHADHAVMSLFTGEAIISLRQEDETYRPMVFETIVHSCAGDACWPAKNIGVEQLEPYAMPCNLEAATPLRWDERICIAVPEAMRICPLAQNMKHQALEMYQTQNFDYIGVNVKADEIYWPRNYDGIAYFAKVRASSERASTNPALDQSAQKAVDGVRDGYSTSLADTGVTSHYRFPFGEWVTNGEKAGAWLRLDWERPYRIKRVVLYDRPSERDQVLKGRLLFSDGSTEEVGELPSNGGPCVIDFDGRTVTWLCFVVEQVSETTENVGLSEIEVFEG